MVGRASAEYLPPNNSVTDEPHCVATEADRDAVNRLRVAEYARSPEFELLDSESNEWHPTDAGVVLVAVSAGCPVATMCATVVDDQAAAEDLLECRVSISTVKFPALILTRAATCRSRRATGLNTALRYHLLSAAGAVRCVLGAVYAGAPRLGVLIRMGYEFVPEPSWENDVRPRRGRSLVVLTGEKLPAAVALLAELEQQTLAEFPWRGPRLLLGLSSTPTGSHEL